MQAFLFTTFSGTTRDNPIHFFGQIGILAEASMVVFGEVKRMTSRRIEVKPYGAEEHYHVVD